MNSTARPGLRFVLSRPQYALAIGFGAGLVPMAPGTVGTLLGYPLFAALQVLPPVERAVAYAVLFGLGVWCCGATERALGRSDPGCIVWDEILAMSLVLEFAPPTLPFLVLAFLLFRFFDIVKPWPIYLADRLKAAGFAIMLDDLLAAAAAIAVMTAVVRLLAAFGVPGV